MVKKGRSFTFTLNNWTEDEFEVISELDCKYLVVGKETGEGGTPHLQGYISFANPRSFNAVKALLGGRAHVEVARGTGTQNRDYCTKDGDFFEKGELPQDPAGQGEAEKERWRLARLAAREGRFEDIPDDLYVRYQNSFKRIRKEDVADPNDLPQAERYGVWLWGPPRTGKSHRARNDYGNVYLKDINKWWDGYDGQLNVLIDELSPGQSDFMVVFLKKWVDRWKFSAETKGGKVVIRPQLIIVTSNYSIEECFANSTEVDRLAIKSRFEEIEMTEVYQI